MDNNIYSDFRINFVWTCPNCMKENDEDPLAKDDGKPNINYNEEKELDCLYCGAINFKVNLLVNININKIKKDEL